VRILFDQGTPVPLRGLLNPHQVETAFERGWRPLRNSDLLVAAERGGFEVFVMTDKNLPNQQNLGGLKIAIVVRSSTSWPRSQKSFIIVKQAIDVALPGGFKQIEIP
jgi:hypothetical protein